MATTIQFNRGAVAGIPTLAAGEPGFCTDTFQLFIGTAASGNKLIGPGGSGTVTTVSVVTANGVSGSVANATTTPAITITLGAITPTTVNKVTITAPATSATLTIANGKTFTASNTLTLAGTDGSTLNVGAGGTLGTAAYTAASAYEVPLTFSTGLNRATNTITNTLATTTQSANLIFAGPASGSAAAPTFRAQVMADMPAALPVRVVDLATRRVLPAYTVGGSGPGATLEGAANGQLYIENGTGIVAGQTILISKQNVGGAGSGETMGVYYVTTAGDASHKYKLTCIYDVTADGGLLVKVRDNALVFAGTWWAWSSDQFYETGWGVETRDFVCLPTTYACPKRCANYHKVFADLPAYTQGAYLNWDNAIVATSNGSSGFPTGTSIVYDDGAALFSVSGLYLVIDGGSVSTPFAMVPRADWVGGNVDLGALVAVPGTPARLYCWNGVGWNTAGGGSVTSVGLSLPAMFTVSGSPVTLSGTLTAVLATQVKNKFFVGPASGADAAPTFRVMDVADLPALTGLTAADIALTDGIAEYNAAASANRQVAVDRVLAFGNPAICEGRLTLTTAVPVTTADVATATTVYFTPCNGNRISIYDGTRWRLYALTEISLALGTLTSGKNYDVFIYDSSGTLTLEFLVWTNDTTRATALVLQDGVWCKTGALTRRWLGTFRTISTTTTTDTAQQRFLLNGYNKVARRLLANPAYSDGNSASTYTTTSTTLTAANAGTNSKAEFLSDGQNAYFVTLTMTATNSGAAANYAAIGEDSTGTGKAFCETIGTTGNTVACSYGDTLSEGYHYVNLLIAVSAGTGTYYADTTRIGGSSDPRLTYILGFIMG